jgi:hypothetical protein
MFLLSLISHNAHSSLGLECITPHYTDTFILYGMVSIIVKIINRPDSNLEPSNPPPGHYTTYTTPAK